jgi:hypothetical protein
VQCRALQINKYQLYSYSNNYKEFIMAGKFEVYKDKTNKFRFRLKAGNGEVIAVGEAYESKAGCLNGIESIRKNAPDATVVEIENN